MNNEAYLRYLSIFLLTGLILVGLFNYLVDPYSVFQSPRIEGFNAQKVGFTKYLRFTKARLVAVREPDAIILGTSRTGYGLAPDHPGFSDSNAFNLGLADMTMFEALRYLRHANNIRPLKKAIFAIDFRLLINRRPNPAFSSSRLALDGVDSRQYLQAWLADSVSALFSYDALATSLRMIRYQTWQKTNLLENGYWLRQQSEIDQHKALRVHSGNTIKRIRLFQQKRSRSKSTPDPLEEYRAFVRYCYHHRIELYLLISPSHAWHWETLRAMGVWPTFKNFKRQLTLINEEEARRSGQKPFPLWDFSGYNRYSTERAPLFPNDERRLNWFWETVHYKRALGDRMLDRLFEIDSSQGDTSSFGMRLTSSNLDAHEAQIARDHRLYQASHPNEIRIIQQLLEQKRL